MRILFILFLCALLSFPFNLHCTTPSATTDSSTISPTAAYQNFTSVKIKDLQKIVGRKLTMREKLSFLVLKHVVKKKARDSKQGQTALTFGIAGAVMFVLGLFIPYVIIGALIAAILAVVLGSVAKKEDPSDKKAFAGTLLGWITLGGIALVLLLVIIILSSGWFWI